MIRGCLFVLNGQRPIIFFDSPIHQFEWVNGISRQPAHTVATAPATEIFCRLNGTSLWGELRISLGLVDLSRIYTGFFLFFREVHPGSEMASQNDQKNC